MIVEPSVIVLRQSISSSAALNLAVDDEIRASAMIHAMCIFAAVCTVIKILRRRRQQALTSKLIYELRILARCISLVMKL